MTPSVFPILSLVLTGGDSPAQLRDYAFYQLAPHIKTIPDVLYANVAGGDVREIEVIARPDDLLAPACPPPTSPTRSARRTASSRSAASRASRSPTRSSSTTRPRRPARSRTWSSRPSNGPAAARPRRGRRADAAPGPRRCRSATTSRTPWSSPSSAAWAATRSTSRTTSRAAGQRGLTLPVGDPDKPPPRNIQATVVYDQATLRRDGRRQRPRRHPGRRPVQRPDPAGLPAQLAGDAHLGPGHPDDAGHHLPVPALDRRDAQPDVAGRPGRRHRPHHRRHGGGHREHRPALSPGRRTAGAAPLRGTAQRRAPAAPRRRPTRWTPPPARSPGPSSARR